RRGRERDREIIPVAGANADRAIGSAHLRRLSAGRGGDVGVVVAAAKQPVEKSTLLPRECRRAILRAAVIVAERDQQRLTLGGAFGGPAVQPFQTVLHVFQPRPLLVDAPRERAAFARRIAEDRKEARALAAGAARLRHQPVHLELLAVDGILRAADLLRALRIGVAAVERGKLRLQLLTGRIGIGLLLRQNRAAAKAGGGNGDRQFREKSPHARHHNALIVAARGSVVA